MEQWLPIASAPGYEVSNEGRVRSVDRTVQTAKGPQRFKGRVLKLALTGRQRRYAGLSINGKFRLCLVHRLVALAFLPNPQNLPEVNHIDTDPLNNRVSNLEWIGSIHNVHHYTSSAKHAARYPLSPSAPKSAA